MNYGEYNYNKIKFLLDVLQTPQEKLNYLEHIKQKVLNVIECFQSPKVLPIRNYGDDSLQLADNCPELKNFIKTKIASSSLDPNDKRNPSNETLKSSLKNECAQYEKLIMLLDHEIEFLKKKELLEFNDQTGGASDEQAADNVKKKAKKNEFSDLDPVYFEPQFTDKSLYEQDYIRKSKIVWQGTEEDLNKFFDALVDEGLLPKGFANEKESLIAKYFVNRKGKSYKKIQKSEEFDIQNWAKGATNLKELKGEEG